jgi:hypothetical protein
MKAMLLPVVLFLTLAAIPVVAQELPRPSRILTGSGSRVDPVTAQKMTDFVPTPGHSFITNVKSTILVLFTSTANMADDGNVLQFQGVLDGKPVNPGPMQLSGRGWHSLSYSGFTGDVPAGKHLVTMQMMVDRGKASIGNRTFSIWIIPQ